MASKSDNSGTKGRGRKYWRSLEELAETPKFRKFLEREFPTKASEWLGSSRRSFLKLMGASMALAGLASCRRWPEDNLVPYARRPVNRMDGMPVHYTTAMEFCGVGIGLIAASVDGRPIKIEGNPDHPEVGNVALRAAQKAAGKKDDQLDHPHGGTDAYTQASILDLYDPERSRTVTSEKKASSWQAFFDEAGQLFKGKVAVLSEASRSPTVARLRNSIKADWYEYEPISADNARAGTALAFGSPARPVLDLAKADVIVSIDLDLFSGDPESVKWSRDFASRRKLYNDADAEHTSAKMNQLWVIESNFSLSGSNADHRLAVRPSKIATYVAAIAEALKVEGFHGEVSGKEEKEFVETLAAAVIKAGSKAVVTAGPRQPAAVHALVAAINNKIASSAVTYRDELGAPPSVGEWKPGAHQLAALTGKLSNGEYDTLLIIGGNPVWNAPADVKFAEALANPKVKSIHLSTHADETSEKCTWHLPRAHYLEAWGDVQGLDGSVAIAQPLIEPMFNGKSVIELLAALGGIKKTGLELVRETHKADNFTWSNYLKTGVIASADIKPASLGNRATDKIKAEFNKLPKEEKGIDVSLYAGNFFDGRFSNNAWLAEMPEPMTRLTWDNACLVNPKTAKKLDLLSDDVVEVTTPGGTKVKLPVLIQPGVAEETFALALGFGRGKVAGSISSAEQDAAELVHVNRNGFLFATLAEGLNASGLTATKAEERYILCTVQDHNVIDSVGKNRMHHLVPELVVEGTMSEYQKAASLGVSKVVSLSMFNEFQYNGHKWGMAIDLTTCTGCSACVIACQAENNVPIVGKEQVGNGREMQWIRIDRYFKSGADIDNDQPQAVHQPVMCMHCEMAPCESVCPVAATTHSDEGLNMMTYNRCIGTRYCSNNCPYKVRRFNFFDYNAGTTKNLYKPNLLRDDLNEVTKMQKNPQVTVRTRGVMEKCTYCVQRIENTRITAKNEGNRAIKDGEVLTACQQVCPTQAIVFGDLNLKDSKVAKLHAVARTYGLLDPELNTKPRTRYIAKLRNPVEGLQKELFEHELELEEEHHGAEPAGAGAAHETKGETKTETKTETKH